MRCCAPGATSWRRGAEILRLLAAIAATWAAFRLASHAAALLAPYLAWVAFAPR